MAVRQLIVHAFLIFISQLDSRSAFKEPIAQTSSRHFGYVVSRRNVISALPPEREVDASQKTADLSKRTASGKALVVLNYA